jgi:hypothetical protein
MATDFRNRRIFTTGQIAELLECSIRVAIRLVDQGVFVSFRIPGPPGEKSKRGRRVLRENVLKFFEDHPDYAWARAKMESSGDGEQSGQDRGFLGGDRGADGEGTGAVACKPIDDLWSDLDDG